MRFAYELTAELRKRLEEEATRRGTEPDALLISIVDASLPLRGKASDAVTPVLSFENEAECFRHWADHQPRRGVPIIPLEAMDREHIYGDHA